MNLPNRIIIEILLKIPYRQRIPLYTVSKLWCRLLQSAYKIENDCLYDQIQGIGNCSGPICLDYRDKLKYSETIHRREVANDGECCFYLSIYPSVYIKNFNIDIPFQDFISMHVDNIYYISHERTELAKRLYNIEDSVFNYPVSPTHFLKLDSGPYHVIIKCHTEIKELNIKYDIYKPIEPNIVENNVWFRSVFSIDYIYSSFELLLSNIKWTINQLKSAVITHLIFQIFDNEILSISMTLDSYNMTTSIIHKYKDWYIVKLVPKLFDKDISPYCIDCSKFQSIAIHLKLLKEIIQSIEVYYMYVG